MLELVPLKDISRKPPQRGMQKVQYFRHLLEVLPPPTLRYYSFDGAEPHYFILDGRHRIEAMAQEGYEYVLADVRRPCR